MGRTRTHETHGTGLGPGPWRLIGTLGPDPDPWVLWAGTGPGHAGAAAPPAPGPSAGVPGPGPTAAAVTLTVRAPPSRSPCAAFSNELAIGIVFCVIIRGRIYGTATRI